MIEEKKGEMVPMIRVVVECRMPAWFITFDQHLEASVLLLLETRRVCPDVNDVIVIDPFVYLLEYVNALSLCL